MSQPSQYIPVPVEAAARIGQEYHKDLVIVLTWDSAHAVTHFTFTSWGRPPTDKLQSAQGGDPVAKVLGCEARQLHEDYRIELLKRSYEWVQHFANALGEFCQPDLAELLKDLSAAVGEGVK